MKILKQSFDGYTYSSSRASQCATIFLHERQCPGRPSRLVVVELQDSSLGLAFHVVAPGSFSGAPQEISHGQMRIAHPLFLRTYFNFGEAPISTRAYAGQIDPSNQAKFTIRFAVAEEQFILSGELMPDDPVRLTGPAKAECEQAFERIRRSRGLSVSQPNQ